MGGARSNHVSLLLSLHVEFRIKIKHLYQGYIKAISAFTSGLCSSPLCQSHAASFLSVQPDKLRPLEGALHLLCLLKGDSAFPPVLRLTVLSVISQRPNPITANSICLSVIASPCQLLSWCFTTMSLSLSLHAHCLYCCTVVALTSSVRVGSGVLVHYCLLWMSVCWLKTVLHIWTFFRLNTKTDLE